MDSSPTEFPALVADPDYIWQPRRKFQDRVGRHIILLVLTIVTTTLAGMNHYAAFQSDFGTRTIPLIYSELIPRGFFYSGTILAILGCHELGHYFACRYYDVDASLPFFLPMPMPLTGTLGAFIRIREPIPSKRMLFDIGIAGPIAGFVGRPSPPSSSACRCPESDWCRPTWTACRSGSRCSSSWHRGCCSARRLKATR